MKDIKREIRYPSINYIGIKDDMLVIGTYVREENQPDILYVYKYPEMISTKIIYLDKSEITVNNSEYKMLFNLKNIELPEEIGKVIFMTE